MTCPDCQHLQAQNNHLRQRIIRLERLIAQVLYYCNQTKQQADYVLSHKSGVKRHLWIMASATRDVADKVITLLSG